MNQLVKANAIKFGLIAASIGVVFTILAYVVDLSLLVNTWITSSLFVLSIVIFIIGVSSSKKQMGGFISFKDAFSSYIVSYLIAGAIGLVLTYLLFNVIDPSSAETLKEMGIEKSIEMMEDWGTDPEIMENAITKAEEQEPMSLTSQFQGFGMGVVFHAIVGLIVAAIIKKVRPIIYEDDMEVDNFGENE